MARYLESFLWSLEGCGTRRTVCFGENRFSGRLDFGGKFDVPQLVTINKSASYGLQWNRIRIQQLSDICAICTQVVQRGLCNSSFPTAMASEAPPASHEGTCSSASRGPNLWVTAFLAKEGSIAMLARVSSGHLE